SQQESSPLSGRKSTQATVRICGASSLDHGQLRFLIRLLTAHSKLRATLFVTADWRAKHPSVSHPLLMHIPGVRRLWCEWNTLPEGTMRIDRFPRFIEFLKNLPRVEIGLHGLTHNRGRHPTHLEYLDASEEECRRSLAGIFQIFHAANLAFVPGMSPPGWYLSHGLARAMRDAGLTFVGSSRDLVSAVHREARSGMSGLTGTSLIAPQWISGGLLNFTTNYQATSTIDRARSIIDHGGLLAIKAHVIKRAGSYVGWMGSAKNIAITCMLCLITWRQSARTSGGPAWARLPRAALRRCRRHPLARRMICEGQHQPRRL
ncbi:hypothetical protein JQ614_34675, partial [Bradyrhizobium diazoefficiens]|uniref:hypothetical protein n=1 Tax=Bradyrhizobium diazoefficiens TaxID=1355477 RepID=UPI001B8ADF22